MHNAHATCLKLNFQNYEKKFNTQSVFKQNFMFELLTTNYAP